MSETGSLYVVKAGCTIHHRGVMYSEGSKVQLEPKKARIHASNVALFEESVTDGYAQTGLELSDDFSDDEDTVIDV